MKLKHKNITNIINTTICNIRIQINLYATNSVLISKRGKETAKNLSFIFYTTNIHKKYNK
ncbi:hypothetical protein PFUGPA_05488 [Plasmodium falciparum Palo Alto/Uganda]|uniref:Uncharacterized protein n=1 Tax=Plasmodium falciparum (isolate Palo Alto / Uganda) TaxID=57270 RepID=W4IT52_PLAFP|nr:hypothetical protein PFUGPA_05488 [Plasmodium falciparum Palo Alto/Uganda]